MISNRYIALEIESNKLKVKNQISNETIELKWPAITVEFNGKRISPTIAEGEDLIESENSLSQSFKLEKLIFTVKLILSENSWFSKSLDIYKTLDKMSTPNYVEVDCQELDDSLELCGYIASNQKLNRSDQAEEEGCGTVPGCGYPLIGRNFFVGLEHPAGFNSVEFNQYTLRHYPVWINNKLEKVDAVFGWSKNPSDLFADYLDSIRIPILDKPLIAYGTFWSDSYLGNNEYAVSYENYKSFFKAFEYHGLIPDIFTLDAGWQDRKSIFQSKNKIGHDQGLINLRKIAKDMGADLSLWLSHNGHMGIDPEFMKKNGFEIGAGRAAAYSGSGYGVMMYEKFKEALTKRFIELIEVVKAIHFKIDWDNECATNNKFKEIYPTENHVRQASLNAMFQIDRAMRKVNENIITRNGWWPSPWWLCHANHIWLPDSGDSENAEIPSSTQRDSTSTHRDLMYYNVLQRDKTALPLDCFDNHELPDAPRNPFKEEPVSWTNAVWLSFMRGSTYLAYTLQPESLEDWQVKSLKQITEFCRIHSKNIFVKKGRMVLGHPGKGEIYGFIQPNDNESWCLLRNPLPVPQVINFDASDIADHSVRSARQFYPHYEDIPIKAELTMLAHEVKIIILNKENIKLNFKYPHIVQKNTGYFDYKFPSSIIINDSVHPIIDDIYQLPKFEFDDVIYSKNSITFSLTVPYRMRNSELQIKISSEYDFKISFKAFNGRYPEARLSCYALPIKEIPQNQPGYGEKKNQDGAPSKNQKFFSIEIPDGGISNYRLEFANAQIRKFDIEIWAAGYEAPSRSSLNSQLPPCGFEGCLPYQHPKGFGKAIKL